LRGVEAAERLSDALGPTIGMRLLDVLAEALEIGAQLPAGHVEVRLAGQEPSLVTSRRAMLRPPRRRPRPGSPPGSACGCPSRWRPRWRRRRPGRRVGEHLDREDARARAVGIPAPRIGNRLTGFGRS
jgi:hypothetical protein